MDMQASWDFRDPYEWMARVSRSTLPPTMIGVALTGTMHGKEANPNLPELIDEQIEAAYEAYQAGAISVHVHLRDPENPAVSVNDSALFSKVNEGIRKHCPGMIVNNSTSGSALQSATEKIASVFADVKPDMCSFNPGPFMLETKFKDREAPLLAPRKGYINDTCIPITYGDVRYWAKTMKEMGIKPEIEIFNPGQFWSLNELISKDLVDPPYIVQFVMGFQTGSYACPQNLMNMIDNCPKNCIFFVPGVGAYQLPMNVMGIVLGGHVRVGLEDNVYYRKGELAKSSAQQVERIRRISEEMNRPIASTAQAREMMGLPPA